MAFSFIRTDKKIFQRFFADRERESVKLKFGKKHGETRQLVQLIASRETQHTVA